MADSTPAATTDAEAPQRTISRKQIRHLSHDAVLEESGPSRLAFLTILLIVGLIVGAVGWSHYVQITTSATAQGSVVPSGDERIVQHLEGGIIREIAVKDGALVEAGQLLVRFDPVQGSAELKQMRAREGALSVRETVLRAQLDGGEPAFGSLGETYAGLVEEARIRLQAARERVAGQEAVLNSRIAQRRKSVDVYRKQAASLVNQRKLVREAVTMRQKLYESGHGSRVNLLNSQLELSRIEGSLSEARVSAEQANVAVEEAKNQLIESRVNERNKALEELSQVIAELAEIRENMAQLEDRVERLSVTAPINGLVNGLQVNTIGAVVQPGQVLMSIVPVDENVVIEARIEPKDIGHVRVGQETKVTVTGFDSRRYGTVIGEMMQLSPTTFTDENGEPFFKGRILLSDDKIDTSGGSHMIVPGMTVSASISTGNRTLLQYLTGPVHTAVMNAFAER